MQYLNAMLKNGRMISVRFQGKPFSITVIQVYAPTRNAEEAEVEWLALKIILLFLRLHLGAEFQIFC